MKKLSVLLVLAMMLIVFSGCSESTDDNSSTSSIQSEMYQQSDLSKTSSKDISSQTNHVNYKVNGENPSSDFKYDVVPDSNGKDGVIITLYKGKDDEVVIPQKIDGYNVFAIGTCSFSDTGIISVTIPDSVTTVTSGAFYECEKLTEVTIGSSVINISDYAFNGCPKLNKITFKGDAPKIGIVVFGEPNKDVRIYYKKGATGFKESSLAKDYTLVEY